MEIMTGGLYFVSDEFFAKIQDPYLKINYENTKRPHYFAFRDSKTVLLFQDMFPVITRYIDDQYIKSGSACKDCRP